MLQAIVGATNPGYPYLMAGETNSNISDMNSLTAYANGRLNSARNPVQTASFSLPASVFFPSGVTTGDEVQLAINDAYMQGMIPGRIIAYDVKTQTAGSPEIVDVTLGNPL